MYHSVVDELQVSTSRRENSAPQGHRWRLSFKKLNVQLDEIVQLIDLRGQRGDAVMRAGHNFGKRGQSDVVGVGSAAKEKDLNKRLINPINQLIQESQPDQKVGRRSDLWATRDHRLINWRLENWSTDWYHQSISWPMLLKDIGHWIECSIDWSRAWNKGKDWAVVVRLEASLAVPLCCAWEHPLLPRLLNNKLWRQSSI